MHLCHHLPGAKCGATCFILPNPPESQCSYWETEAQSRFWLPKLTNQSVRELESEPEPFQSDWATQVRCSQHWTNQHGLEVARHRKLEVALGALLPGKSQEETCDPLHCHPLGFSREIHPPGKPPSSQLGATILLTCRAVPGIPPPPPASSLGALSPTGGLPWGVSSCQAGVPGDLRVSEPSQPPETAQGCTRGCSAQE